MRVPYARAIYGREEIDAVNRVLEDSPLTLIGGPEVVRFEERVAALFGKRYGLMVNSGSSANTLAVAAIELEPGAEVITPVLTFSTTVAPLVQQGLVPAFVDVEPDTFNIDAGQVEDVIGPRTRAMMVPNLIGNLPDWAALREIADRHGLSVVEDSADTIGSTYRDAPMGRLSDIATTSFYASHVVTAAGFGGMLTTDDPEVERRARLLRGWGRTSSILGESEAIEDRFDVDLDGIEYDAKFLFSALGYNFLPSEVAAAFGNVQLDRLGEYTRRRVENFSALRAFFANYGEWFVLPRQNPDAVTPWLAFPLIVRDEAPFTRRELQIHLETAGIQTRVVFTGNVLRQPALRDVARREHPGGYPNADRVTRGGLLLGCHQGMAPDQIDHVTDTFGEFAAAR
jgi:CDP-4-dehydro-6-deoxyglucose reductase, E1